MIQQLAMYWLQRSLDRRAGVPRAVRWLGAVHPPTARAVAELLEVDTALASAARRAQPAEAIDAPGPRASRRDPAWWSSGGAGRIGGLVAAGLALAALVAVGGWFATQPRGGAPITQTPTTRAPADVSPTFALALPTLPDVANPLATPARAVQPALQPAVDPGVTLRLGVERLGQGLEAPLRREWSAIVTQFAQLESLVRTLDPAEAINAADPADLPAPPAPGGPATRRGEPRGPAPVAAV